MIDLDLRSLRRNFFDRQQIRDRLSQTGRRVLSRFGAFVRQRARTSIRPRKGISTPGGPPHSHTGLLRRFILFSYDRSRESVVIGPARLNSVASRGAPAALEYGGRATTLDTSYVSGRRVRRRRSIDVRARPFMGPAFEVERPRLAELWRDSVR